MSVANKYTTLTSEKIPSVHEAGKQAEYDAFWDVYQNYGNPTRYHYAFTGSKWNDTNFKPKYDIVLNSETSNYLFNDSDITEINVNIDTRNNKAWYQIAYGATKLQKIQKIILKDDGSQVTQGPFTDAKKLTYVRFEGKIGVSASMSACPLDLNSAKNVIEHLMDYAGTDNDMTYKITFSDTTKALLEAEGATSPNGNTWLDYANDKGWNV